MTFHIYGEQNDLQTTPVLLLVPGLGVSHEIFLPLIKLLEMQFHIVTVDIDGFLLNEKSHFTSIDDQAEKIIRYVNEHCDLHIDVAYGISLGGKILSRILERNEIKISHAIMDAAPLLPLPKLIINPLRYYQCFSVWTCYYFAGFWKALFRSHYFDVLLDEVKKVYLSGKGRSVLAGYKDVYTTKLESIHGNDIHFWYGTKEAFVAKAQVKHLLCLFPAARIEVFERMNHGQLLVDRPEEIAKRIMGMIKESA